VAVVLLVLAGGVAFVLLHAPGNVSHPTLSFTAPTKTTQPKHHKAVAPDDFVWPWYGYDAARTRYFADAPGLHPPFHTAWTYNDFALLEFPPAIYHTTMFFVDDNGMARALDKDTGKAIWHHKIGTLAAASPAISTHDHLVYVPTLARHGSSPGAGALLALSMKTGRTVWRHDLPAGSESSPIVWRGRVYFGDQRGNVYSLNAANGHVYWTYHASAAVKGGPAISGGILYFGDYAGRAYGIRLSNGHQLWAVSTSGTHFGFGAGNFYSTPAVAYGRVYLGNTDGRVYSFAARTGQLAWATTTGSYVYGSPAVADIKGLGPTVYVGSYDGFMYAFNAQSGSVRWRHYGGGKISGSATVVGNVVYYSDLGNKTTAGLDARTGRQVFGYHIGAFNPVIADEHALYVVGYTTIAKMVPKGVPAKPHKARKKHTTHKRESSHHVSRHHRSHHTRKRSRHKATRRHKAPAHHRHKRHQARK
jgi:outer membrane protein assembly factor BamB